MQVLPQCVHIVARVSNSSLQTATFTLKDTFAGAGATDITPSAAKVPGAPTAEPPRPEALSVLAAAVAQTTYSDRSESISDSANSKNSESTELLSSPAPSLFRHRAAHCPTGLGYRRKLDGNLQEGFPSGCTAAFSIRVGLGAPHTPGSSVKSSCARPTPRKA